MNETKPPEDCPTCRGTGEVHSHNPQCWDCCGTGIKGFTRSPTRPSETKPPEGQPNLEFILEHFGDEDRTREAESELAALRARLAKLEAKPEPPTPEVGKVYWARRLYKGIPCGPFRLQVLALTPKIIEYRENNWSGIRSAIMRDDLEIVEETTWE